MEVEIGRGKKARQAYGFDDIAIVPSRRTRDPQDVDIGWKLGPHLLELPLLALPAGQALLLTPGGVLASLDPVSTVVLAQLVLRERLAATQAAGLVAAGVAVVLIALPS